MRCIDAGDGCITAAADLPLSRINQRRESSHNGLALVVIQSLGRSILHKCIRRYINRQQLRGASVEANGFSPPAGTAAAVYHGICGISHPG